MGENTEQENFTEKGKEKLNSLLKGINIIRKEEDEQLKKNGEQFNIFQITGKQSAEQHTHSAFIAELLKPDGKHEMGDVFLELFLNILDEKMCNEEEGDSGLYNKFREFYNPENILESKFLKKTKVFVEKRVGKIRPKPQVEGDRCAKGGNIDILLMLNDNYLTIENKIDAPDQINQIIRYRNYEKDNNIVFFLTLDGKEPDIISKGSLKSGIDYYCISYEDQIVEWLKKCIEVNGLKPNIKLSINQYKVLILKLTSQMENQADFNKEIYKNHESAKMIHKKYEKAMESLRIDFRKKVYDSIKNKLSDYTLEKRAPKKHSMIFIKSLKPKDPEIFFAIAAFSERNYLNKNNKLFVGIRNDKGKEEKAKTINYEFEDVWWPLEKELYSKELTNDYLVELNNDKGEREKVIQEIVDNIKAFIDEFENKVKRKTI